MRTQTHQKLKQIKDNTKDCYKNGCEEVERGGVRRERLSMFLCFLLKTF